MMKKFLFLFLFLSQSLIAQELFLKDKIQEALPGNYLVTTQDKNFTFVNIYDKKNDYIILEEVNIPAARAPRGISWKGWFEKGAPGHTSWTHSLLNLRTGRFEASYSFTYGGWLDTSEMDHFMATLLNLKFYPISEETRRRIGKAPGYGKLDIRPIWHPKLMVEGKEVPTVYFKAFKARWPNDHSELSTKKIEIYLPEKNAPSASHPTFFPYWVEVEGKLASGRIRVIDSGQGAHSPKPYMPQAPLTLIEKPTMSKEGLSVKIKAPQFCDGFILLIEEVDSPLGKTLLLPHKAKRETQEEVLLSVEASELQKQLTPGERYRVFVSTEENHTVFLESDTELLFSPEL